MRTNALPKISTLVIVLALATVCYGRFAESMPIAFAPTQNNIYPKMETSELEFILTAATALEKIIMPPEFDSVSALISVAEGKTKAQSANRYNWQSRLEVPSGGGQIGQLYSLKIVSYTKKRWISEAGGGQIG